MLKYVVSKETSSKNVKQIGGVVMYVLSEQHVKLPDLGTAFITTTVLKSH